MKNPWHFNLARTREWRITDRSLGMDVVWVPYGQRWRNYIDEITKRESWDEGINSYSLPILFGLQPAWGLECIQAQLAAFHISFFFLIQNWAETRPEWPRIKLKGSDIKPWWSKAQPGWPSWPGWIRHHPCWISEHFILVCFVSILDHFCRILDIYQFRNPTKTLLIPVKTVRNPFRVFWNTTKIAWLWSWTELYSRP